MRNLSKLPISARRIGTALAVGAIAMGLVSCAASTGRVETGMTPDQTISAIGQPDLKDAVPDPHGSGATVLRYAWVSRGKVATFGPDNRVAKVADLPASTGSTAAGGAASNGGAAATAPDLVVPQTPSYFDPVQTPLNYLFYPLKFGFTWIGAGVNCVAEGDCHRPEVKPPDAG